MARVIHWASVFFTVCALAILTSAVSLVASDHHLLAEQQQAPSASGTQPHLVVMGAYSDDEAPQSRNAGSHSTDEGRQSSLVEQIGREQFHALRRTEITAIRAYLNDFVLHR
jgi:hypothetical protein